VKKRNRDTRKCLALTPNPTPTRGTNRKEEGGELDKEQRTGAAGPPTKDKELPGPDNPLQSRSNGGKLVKKQPCCDVGESKLSVRNPKSTGLASKGMNFGQDINSVSGEPDGGQGDLISHKVLLDSKPTETNTACEGTGTDLTNKTGTRSGN